MLTDLKALFTRCAPSFAQDVAGAAVLVAMLVVGLNLPLFS